ncbi:MAG: RDD family protein [Planctomycetota bacterium]|nr:RDD family protein [Planctomycetota bacterium]
MICSNSTASPAPSDVLLGASSGEHLWFVAEAGDGDESVRLCHHALAMAGPYADALMVLPRRPEAIAAWEDEVFLVFAPQPSGRPQPREVYRLRAVPSPVHEGYLAEPADRLEVLDSLPGEGKLAGIVGSARGPVALLVPPQRAESGVTASSEAAAAEPILQAPRLLRWTGGRWAALELPAGAALTGPCRLAVGGVGGELIFILAGAGAADDDAGTLHLRRPDGRWTSRTVSLEPGRVRSFTRVDGQVLAVIASARDERCRLAYLRPNLVLPLSEFSRPGLPWTVLGMRDGPRIVTARRAEDAAIRPVDAMTGELDERRTLTRPPANAMSILRMPFLLAITILVLAIVIRYRPGARAPVSLPGELAALPPTIRLTAVAIDLVPGGLVAMLLLSCRPGELFGLPFMATTFEASLPYLVMISVTILHSVVGELIWRRTIGKAMVGARLWPIDGRPLPAGRILLRNLLKLLILLIPPLAILALMDPNLQGLNDLVGRTIVVRPREETEEEPNDR